MDNNSEHFYIEYMINIIRKKKTTHLQIECRYLFQYINKIKIDLLNKIVEKYIKIFNKMAS